MNSQINFTISPQKEKALFSFLSEECSCSILKGYGKDRDFSVDILESPSLLLYFIVPQDFTNYVTIVSIRDESLDADFGIYPFDENANNLPLIRYERFGDIFRIYAGTSNMDSQGKAEVKSVLKKVKQWLKSNADSQKREGSPFCGITVYEIK